MFINTLNVRKIKQHLSTAEQAVQAEQWEEASAHANLATAYAALGTAVATLKKG